MKFLVFLCLFISVNVYSEKASDVAAEYFADIDNGNIYELGEYYHPEALKEFRGMMNFIFNLDEASQKKVVNEFLGLGLRPYEIKLMNDAEFLSLILEYVENVKKQFKKIDIQTPEVIGEFSEEDGIAYVVTSNKGSVLNHSLETFEVTRLKKHGDNWRLLLHSSIKTFALEVEKAAGVQ